MNEWAGVKKGLLTWLLLNLQAIHSPSPTYSIDSSLGKVGLVHLTIGSCFMLMFAISKGALSHYETIEMWKNFPDKISFINSTCFTPSSDAKRSKGEKIFPSLHISSLKSLAISNKKAKKNKRKSLYSQRPEHLKYPSTILESFERKFSTQQQKWKTKSFSNSTKWWNVMTLTRLRRFGIFSHTFVNRKREGGRVLEKNNFRFHPIMLMFWKEKHKNFLHNNSNCSKVSHNRDFMRNEKSWARRPFLEHGNWILSWIVNEKRWWWWSVSFKMEFKWVVVWILWWSQTFCHSS